MDKDSRAGAKCCCSSRPRGWSARPSSPQAEKAFDRFTLTYAAKYPKATECLRKDRGALLAFVFKLGLAAETRWRRIRGFEQLAKIIEGVKFTDGVETENLDRAAA